MIIGWLTALFSSFSHHPKTFSLLFQTTTKKIFFFHSFTFPVPDAVSIGSPISNFHMNIDIDASSLTFKAGLSFKINDQTHKRHNNDTYHDDKR